MELSSIAKARGFWFVADFNDALETTRRCSIRVTTSRAIIMLLSELLSDKKNWIRRAYARDKDGNSINPHHTLATSFCIVGACRKCDVHTDTLESIIVARGFTSLENFNDSPRTTHEDVLSVLQQAGL